MYLLPPLTLYTGQWASGLMAGTSIVALEHAMKIVHYYSDARRVNGDQESIFNNVVVALGAGSVLSAQEVTRCMMAAIRGSFYSLCCRVDWFDGEEPRIKLDIQLQSFFRFALNTGLTYMAFHGLW